MSSTDAVLATASLAQQGAPTIGSNLNVAAAKKAGQDFEAYFLSQAFENMFSGLDADPLFGGGSGESIYRSMMIQQYSKVAAQRGTTGIGAEVTREILKMQEKEQQR
ncbi:MAG TPA: rod-binding protein [Stellaceae bacterium]|nr:rod-binding protein [Stellaceae bacterium]